MSVENPSYPTNSLRFLESLHEPSDNRSETSSIPTQEKANLCLKIIVVGGGLGGLACAIALARSGHSVCVFEQATEFGEVGAGIQIPPNSSRWLLRWGLGPLLADDVVEPIDISIRRWQDGSLVGLTKLVPEFQDSFKSPYYVVHRAHFHQALFRKAIDLGVEVKANSKIAKYDPELPAITLESGKEFTADLIVAADGLRSLARKTILGDKDKLPVARGFAAYRGIVETQKMKADPEIASLVEEPRLNLWLGDRRHVMSYTIGAGKQFNMVLSHPESSDPSTWKQETAIEDMKRQFEGWDPRLTKVISMLESTLKWPLLMGHKLDRWTSESGKLLIVGDAAHPMLPYMSQGAAIAVEDAVALAAVLTQITCKTELGSALAVFEQVRMLRAGQMQDASLINGTLWHYADGPEQKARDAGMRPEVEGKHFIESPNQWSDPLTQWWCYGYDAETVVLDAWREHMKVTKE